jgi:hypothetical protein
VDKSRGFCGAKPHAQKWQGRRRQEAGCFHFPGVFAKQKPQAENPQGCGFSAAQGIEAEQKPVGFLLERIARSPALRAGDAPKPHSICGTSEMGHSCFWRTSLVQQDGILYDGFVPTSGCFAIALSAETEGSAAAGRLKTNKFQEVLYG